MGIPIVSTLASIVLYVATAITLVLSCMRGELFWGSSEIRLYRLR